jgi:hypothetical protein
MGTVIQMQAASTGGVESGLAAIDIPKDGSIEGVEWAAYADFDTDNDLQIWQLSFGSTVANVNDSRQVISNCSVGALTFTAGGSVIARGDKYSILPGIPVGAGERLFLHSSAAAAVVGTVRCVISFSFDLDMPKARRR